MEFSIEITNYVPNEESKKEATEGIELPNQESIGELGKRKPQISVNIRSRYYLTTRNERKSEERIPPKNMKVDWNKTLHQ